MEGVALQRPPSVSKKSLTFSDTPQKCRYFCLDTDNLMYQEGIMMIWIVPTLFFSGIVILIDFIARRKRWSEKYRERKNRPDPYAALFLSLYFLLHLWNTARYYGRKQHEPADACAPGSRCAGREGDRVCVPWRYDRFSCAAQTRKSVCVQLGADDWISLLCGDHRRFHACIIG